MTFDRASGVGGSDAAAILGESPYRGPLDVWLEKSRNPQWKGPAETPAMAWGSLLEPVLREKYAHDEGHNVRSGAVLLPGLEGEPGFKGDITYWHPNRIQYAHLDGWRLEGHDPVIWEGKTSSRPDDWADGIPAVYRVQVQQYMHIVGALRCDVSVYFGKGDFRTIPEDADPVLQDDIESHVAAFWAEYVKTGTPPTELFDPVLLFPVSQDLPRVAGAADLTPLVEEYLDTKHTIDALEEHLARLKEQLQGEIGDAPGMDGPGWDVSWKSNKPSRKTNWEHVATGLENTLHDLWRYREHLPEEARASLDPGIPAVLRSINTMAGRPARPFKVTRSK